MNKQRLLRVAEVLEGVPDEKFNLSGWSNRTSCGTTCCAVGHYAVATPDSGLRLEFGPDGNCADIVDESDRFGWEAVERHFGISARKADYLFALWTYSISSRVTKADVIARIRAYVAEHAEASA